MVTLTRNARGLTQGELARAAGMSQGLVSKAETGSVVLDDQRVAALAEALAVPVSFLHREEAPTSVLSACAFHRKRSSLSVSDARRVRALLDMLRFQVEPLVEGMLPPLRLPRQTPDDDGLVTEIDIARQVRSTFDNPAGPLENLVGQVEKDGVLVLSRPLGSARVDALGSWPTGHRPMFILNEQAPPDRARFTLAHELGHAVMHPVPAVDQERQADRFASELLMPARDIRPELAVLTLPKLAELKTRWKVSMASLIRRARDLGVIRDPDYRRLSIEISTAGYRTREPGELTLERPQLVRQAVATRRQEGADSAELAELAGLLEPEFVAAYEKGALDE